jgi:cytochrome P450
MTITYPVTEPGELDPDPLFQEWRAEQPLVRVRLPYGEPVWLATRYADAKIVLADPRFSRAAALGHDQPRTRPHIPPAGTLLDFDPPEHSRLRRLVTKGFTARRIAELRPHVQGIADGLVDTMIADGSPADLVDGFALPLPVTVICELLGVPFEDRGAFRYWSDAMLSTTRMDPSEVATALGQLRAYLADLVEQRREDLRDDLLSALITARDENDRLSEDELLSLAQLILVAGHETTASQIPNFVWVLLHHPDQLERLKADPDLLPTAVEELMRYVPLGFGAGSARYATEDVELSGVLVREGEPVVAMVGSANRDERAYPDAGTLDLGRQGPTQLGFGHGAHHCLGAPLARMELQIALGTLFSRLPDLRLAGDIAWKKGMSTRGPERMMVAWG